MIKQHIQMVRGDDQPFGLTVTRAGVAQDISGWSFVMTAKTSKTADQAVFELTSGDGDIVVTNGASGLATVTVPADATDGLTCPVTLVYEIEGTDSNSGVHTITSGTLLVEPDLSVPAVP